LTALVVQVHPLLEPVRLTRTAEHAGCASWVSLSVGGVDVGEPAHDVAALHVIAERVRSLVG
jgi:hypothetical protein